MPISILIYLIDLSQSIVALCMILSLMLLGVSLFFFIKLWGLKETLCDDCYKNKSISAFSSIPKPKKLFFLAILLMCVSSFFPSSKTGYLMLASSIGSNLLEKKNITDKVLKVIEHQLEKYAKD